MTKKNKIWAYITKKKAPENKTIETYWQEYFDSNVKMYCGSPGKIVNLDVELQEMAFSIVIEKMIFKNNMNVLDAGCGAGELTLRLLNHTKKVISFDISKNMLQQILERAPKTDFTIINFCQGSLTNLPFKDNAFDYTISLETLQHCNSKIAMSEFIRVTRGGGHIIISVPNAEHPIIKHAERRFAGKYSGLRINEFMAFLKERKLYTDTLVMPIMYYRHKNVPFYQRGVFKKPSLLTGEEQKANRFIIYCRR
ncbi:Ubiquinone/menaquinone biosynthesis C-methylase UbiE [Candidatus Methanophagaceae archaeon]|nr:Ubiquinone/menaquinone biosynthesis C-methylase UbiE [Methanophagales archaeon]